MREDLPPPRHVPTLTEVVRIATPPTAAAPQPLLDEALIVERVLASLHGQIEPAMAPALARAMERLLHETRLALMRTLHEQVVQAVAQAVAQAVPLAVQQAVEQAAGQPSGQPFGPAAGMACPSPISGTAAAERGTGLAG